MRVVCALCLRRARARIAALAAGLGLFVYVVGLSYASIDENAVRSLVESLPPFLRALTGASDLASPTGYLGAAYTHPVALAILGALVVSMATLPARDRESGVVELFLSRPLAPWRWIAGVAAAVFAGLAVVLAGGYVGGVAAIATVGDLGGVSAASLAVVVADAGLVFAAAAGVCLAVATAARGGGQAVGCGAGFLVVSYALNYLAMVWSIARPLGVASIFHGFDPGIVLRTGHVPATVAAWLAGAAVAGTAAALILAQRREPLPS